MTYWVTYRHQTGRVQARVFSSQLHRKLWIAGTTFKILTQWEEIHGTADIPTVKSDTPMVKYDM